MITTVDETGVWNNYAAEPDMYFAEYPSPEKQKAYAIQGSLAVALISALMTVALIAS
ncbi:MAG: ssl1498 family light-harvesting-like protein [Acaryochloridaceae cyanobacterium RL_2_7]|nr:ssl1498 family light-harvesting-like protein [Acaryochloridaceae cyanobacterium RL_2_7]